MPMYEGNWPCSGCGGTITQLPFQPRSDKGLTCRSCYAKGQDKAATAAPVEGTTTATEVPDIPTNAGIATEPPPLDDAFAGLDGLERLDAAAPSADAPDGAAPGASQKPKHEGSWPCSTCDNVITSLPFVPRSTTGLKCIDCFKASKG